MGKSSKRNRGKDRTDPVSKSVKPPSDPELAAIREKQILPIINDLTSPDTKKRAFAAVAIANLIDNTKLRKLLLREQIVKILLEQTTTDSALESKSAGWGILRNLALEEEADFCVHLYRQDILTAISGIVKTLIETIQSQEHPVSKLPKAQQELVWTLNSSVVSLIGSLAESQEDVLEAITKIPAIASFLFTLLGYPDLPEELFNEVLSSLAILTEDNQILNKAIAEHEIWIAGLMQLHQNGGPRAVAACGVLHNVFTSLQWFDHNTPISGASDAALVSTLSDAVKNAQTQADSPSPPHEVLQLALEIIASIATTLQEALEHGNKHEKVFEGFEDDANGEDSMIIEEGDDQELDCEGDMEDNREGDEEEDDEMTQEEMDADMARVTGADDDEEEPIDDQPTLFALVRTATPAILQLAKDSASGGEHNMIRNNALSALNNISWTMSSIDFAASSTTLANVWRGLAQRIWKEIVTPVLESNTADIELASSITSIAWALARSMQGKIQIEPEEQRKFMALYQASKGLESNGTNKTDASGDVFQSLGVKSIGVLGRLALSPAPVSLNREIGVFLLTVLAALPETPAADAVEALDQIFDIYGDKEYECDAEVFVKDGFLKHLEGFVKPVRAMAKSVDKRKDGELRLRADEAVLNLDRFLKYKRDEQKE